MARVTETVVQEKALKVNESGLLTGAKLIGNDSVNGRHYGDSVIESNIGQYVGAKVYLNHPRGRDGALERDFNEWVGVIESAWAKKGGGFGNVQFRTEHPRYREICEAVEKFAGHFGFSHVADIDSERIGTKEEVTRIGEVFSVDLVTDPATTNGVFESKAPTMRKNLKAIVESTKGLVGKKTLASGMRRVLEEAIATGEMPATAEVEVSETGTDEEAVKAGLMAQISAKLDTADASMLKKVLNALGIGDSISGLLAPGPETNTSAPNADAGNPPSPPAEDKKTEMEARKIKAENKLLREGREATPAQIAAVAGVEDSLQAEVIESFPKVGAVRESRRPGESPPKSKSETDDLPAMESIESRIGRKVKEAREKLAAKRK